LYWGLRDYKIPPSIWGGDPCQHEWADEIVVNATNHVDKARWQHTRNGRDEEQPTEKRVSWLRTNVKQGKFCKHCEAWAGALGLEPTYQLYVEHVVEIFRAVWRVLRKDGTLWLNLGDTYHGGGGGNYGDSKSTRTHQQHLTNVRNRPSESVFKPKDLCGVPWRVAFALQNDGWYLRSDIIWAKPNPMPESVTDRPTKSHEYLFLLTKAERYFYDAESIKEEIAPSQIGRVRDDVIGGSSWSERGQHSKGGRFFSGPSESTEAQAGTRNRRSVWEIATSPFPEAHFATMPPALVEPCIMAGTSERGCCTKCGAPWEREIGRSVDAKQVDQSELDRFGNGDAGVHRKIGGQYQKWLNENPKQTTGWYPSCRCDGLPELPSYPPRPDRKAPEEVHAAWRGKCAWIAHKRAELCEKAAPIPVIPAVTIDPFFGAGTTGLVADRLGRDCIGIELSPSYATMAERRLQNDAGMFAQIQMDLFADG
jgi:DNA modification methylase